MFRNRSTSGSAWLPALTFFVGMLCGVLVSLARGAGLIVLAGAVTLPLAACSYTPERTFNDSGLRTSSTAGNEAFASDAVYGISTSGQPSVTEVSPDGISQVSTGPHGAAGLGPFGVSVSSPADVTAETITAEFYDPIEYFDAEGQALVTVLPKRIEVTGFASAASPVITATTAQVELWVDYAKQLSSDDRDRFLRQLDSIDNITAGAVRAGLAAITGGASEAATLLPDDDEEPAGN